jgi:small-conductance mechanosensitive channel
MALSFAFQHTAANILSGLIISIRGSLDLGDLIYSNNAFGNVLRVSLCSIQKLALEELM